MSLWFQSCLRSRGQAPRPCPTGLLCDHWQAHSGLVKTHTLPRVCVQVPLLRPHPTPASSDLCSQRGLVSKLLNLTYSREDLSKKYLFQKICPKLSLCVKCTWSPAIALETLTPAPGPLLAARCAPSRAPFSPLLRGGGVPRLPLSAGTGTTDPQHHPPAPSPQLPGSPGSSRGLCSVCAPFWDHLPGRVASAQRTHKSKTAWGPGCPVTGSPSLGTGGPRGRKESSRLHVAVHGRVAGLGPQRRNNAYRGVNRPRGDISPTGRSFSSSPAAPQRESLPPTPVYEDGRASINCWKIPADLAPPAGTTSLTLPRQN